jgi:type I site-specific restriction endonuclease
MGVPVKPIYEALGKASRKYLAFPYRISESSLVVTTDKSTPAVFGDYIDIYDIKQSVDDGATVPISYESRLVKIKLDEQTTKKLPQLY